MNPEERSEAILGSFDGVVSVLGFIFGLLIHKSSESAIAIGALGGAISATISMGTGAYESAEGKWHRRLQNATAMAIATLVGSLVPVWGFFVFSKSGALLAGGIGCLVVATWIGRMKKKGTKGYASAYLTLILAAGLTLGVISLIPSSA